MILNKKQPVSYKLSWSLWILLLIVNYSFLIVNCFAETRYVSKDGSSTPPYTSWETASDSIQKAINICNDGDTIYVGNGVYKETLIINTELSLIGLSMDSTIIDGTGLTTQLQDYEGVTINIQADIMMENLTIKGKGAGLSLTNVISAHEHSTFIFIKNCKLLNAYSGIGIIGGSYHLENLQLSNFVNSINKNSFNNPQLGKILNCIIIKDLNGTAINDWRGNTLIENNLIIATNKNILHGISLSLPNTKIIKNNIILNFYRSNISMDDNLTDSVFILNNNIGYSENNGIWQPEGNDRLKIINNIIFKNRNSVAGNDTNKHRTDYNLFWKNTNDQTANLIMGENDIIADPMFVKDDTIPSYPINFDFHLQKYSPAIDAGDPNILDVDGSRSDIGMFGGPGGQKYTYQDLAPRNPQNLSAVYDEGVIKLNWNKNSEADFFRYRVYRDTVPNFIYDTTKIIAEISDTLFNDNLKSLNANSYYYKITAIDSSYNQSPASEEITVVITGLGEMPPQIVEDYNLMQNYPNPFNPTTKITYRIKEPGYVKLMVYNILGEIVEVLVNEYKDKGFYEAEFTSTKTNRRGTDGVGEFETMHGHTASGIYLYRIEVIGKGNIPVFSDMKKMILVK
jgi:hypothetical protein